MTVYPFFIPHRGCPHRCLFCDQNSATGRSAAPPPAEVARELERILPPSGHGEAAFYGGTFTLLPRELREGYLNAAAPFLQAGRIGGIRISTRPDSLEGEIVPHMRNKGVRTVELGCQSFSADVLKTVKRGHGPECIAPAVEKLRGSGMRIGLQLIPGLPGGDRQEAIESLEQALSLGPDFLRIYPAVIFRGTGLEDLRENGRYSPPGPQRAASWCADLLLRCRRAGVPVIRMGLQGTPELDSGQLVSGGAYHPAFGQLVRSEIWLRAFRRIVSEAGGTVRVHPADLSDALGHRRANLEAMRRDNGAFSVVPDPSLERESVAWADRRSFLCDLAESA